MLPHDARWRDVPAIGETLDGRYTIERLLGAGGMGLVFAARHRGLGQKVAIKLLVPELSRDPEAVERFLREARASTLLRSERVVRVIDVGSGKNGAPFMVMEYLEGEDLQESLRRGGPLAVPAAVGYVIQAAEALAEAHSLGIIHRDLKPANLFLTVGPDGSPLVKVLDFGISKVSVPGRRGLTRTHAIMGSLGYMAPEQLRSTKHVDQRADVWGLGVVLYELLAGQRAFEGEHLADVSVKIILDSPTPIEEIRDDVSPELAKVIDKCLAKKPATRYQNMGELAEALAPFAPPEALVLVERIRRLARATGPLSPSARPSAASGLRDSPTARAWARSGARERHRQKLAFAVTAVGVALVSALLSVLALGKGSALEALFFRSLSAERPATRSRAAASAAPSAVARGRASAAPSASARALGAVVRRPPASASAPQRVAPEASSARAAMPPGATTSCVGGAAPPDGFCAPRLAGSELAR